jgi:hypothetical protein
MQSAYTACAQGKCSQRFALITNTSKARLQPNKARGLLNTNEQSLLPNLKSFSLPLEEKKPQETCLLHTFVQVDLVQRAYFGS